MATARAVEHEEEDEDSVEITDNRLSLRSRQVERHETDRDQMTHIGIWGQRSTSETRTEGKEKSKQQERDFFYDTRDIKLAGEMDDRQLGSGDRDDQPGQNPMAPPNYDSQDKLLDSLSEIANIMRQNQRQAPSARNISDSVIGLRKFGGTASDRDSVETWLDEFMRYADFRALSLTDRLQLFKILLTGTAADWLATLSVTKTSSFDALIREFKATYFKSPELKWSEARNLFNDPMKAGERVDDFIVRIRKAAKRLNIGEEIIQYCFIAGLLPSLREKVLAKGVTSLEETLKMARIAECCTQTNPVHTLLMDTLKSNNELAQ